MPLQSSGAISFDNLQTEFGNTNPIPLSDYYRGGGLVPNVSQNNNVPTSGAISLSNFYSASGIDVTPDTFNINNISVSGSTPQSANSNQITITSINQTITLNFGTSSAYAFGNEPDPLNFGDETDVDLILDIYVNGSLANSVNWFSTSGGTSGSISLNAKVNVSNNDTVKVGLYVSGSGQPATVSGGATFAITNDSSSNTQLDTFDVYGSVSV